MAYVHRHFTMLPAEARGCVVAIGNFDGVHLGHQKLLEIGRKRAKSLGVPFGVLTFDPHPRWFFNPTQTPFLLSSEEFKVSCLEQQGVDHIFIAKFDTAFAALSAEQFIEDFLMRDLAVVHVVVGADYRFGRGRQGDVAALHRFGHRHGFGVTGVTQFRDGAEFVYSSTRVRTALNGGDLQLAAKILGRSWGIQERVARVVEGVASIPLAEKQRPFSGLYDVRIEVVGAEFRDKNLTRQTVSWVSVCTVDGDEVLQISGVNEDIAGKVIRVSFLEYLGSCGACPSHCVYPKNLFQEQECPLRWGAHTAFNEVASSRRMFVVRMRLDTPLADTFGWM